MEIQKAEEFAIDVFDAIYGNHLSWIDREDGAEGRRNGAALIRARDKAIIERCKALIMADSEPHTMSRNDYICDLLDEVFRDLD